MTSTTHQQDLNARWAPTPEQCSIAAAILASDPSIDAVIVGAALPGMTRGIWTLDQMVEPAPGFWPARNTFDEYESLSYSAARFHADKAAQTQLAGRQGLTSYIAIDRDGTWGTFHGMYGTN